MPELPEVETVRGGLEKYVVGHKILSVDILHPKPFQGGVEDILNSIIIKARRIGKGLILDFENGNSLAIHIKMTGQLIYRDKNTSQEPISPKVKSIPNKYTHLIFHLDRGGVLYYNDMRRFGWIKVIKTNEVMKLPFFKAMGPEPPVAKALEGRSPLTYEHFSSILSKTSIKVKPFIMDQSKIGGIGNIYANDALFKAKIDPQRPAKSLSEKEASDLFESIVAVLKKSLEEGGASELSFVNILGQEGNYQSYTLVYGKTGKKCPRKDGGIIKRIALGGRGTFFCEVCQH